MVRAVFVNLGGLLLAAACLTACEKSPAPTAALPDPESLLPTHAQSRLATIKLWIGPEVMTAEQALTPEQIRTGEMFRTNLPENEGMIFVLDGPQQASFWMKNCPLPLSAAYMDPDGKILELHEFQPQNTNPVVAQSQNIEFVLETPQGWFQRHHISVGTLVTTERGSLKKVYLQ